MDEERPEKPTTESASSEGFAETSYRRHQGHYDRYAAGGEMAPHTAKWTLENTIDAWRHQRMYRLLDPLLDTFPGATWVTIGDGRYGTDAHYLEQRGATVLATDISDTLLREAHANGYITSFQQANAEDLSFEDGTFDFVLCKESYHHFPRPAVGLYEMLRVARVAVVLIEPNDRQISDSLLQAASLAAFGMRARLIGRPRVRDEFEVSGNYAYPASKREFEKVALALNLPHVAFREFNDVYAHGVECNEATARSPLFRRLRRKLIVLDLLTRLRLYKSTNLAAILFKAESDRAKPVMARAGYTVNDLSRNPYV